MEYKTSKKGLVKACERLRLDELAAIIKSGLDENPYKDTRGAMWEEQCLVNFPMLYTASLVLYQYAKERGCNTFLFATRDCCHWHRIFKALYPDTVVHYFASSRLMLETAKHNSHFHKYVSSLLPPSQDVSKVVYLDIHGKTQCTIGARCASPRFSAFGFGSARGCYGTCPLAPSRLGRPKGENRKTCRLSSILPDP